MKRFIISSNKILAVLLAFLICILPLCVVWASETQTEETIFSIESPTEEISTETVEGGLVEPEISEIPEIESPSSEEITIGESEEIIFEESTDETKVPDGLAIEEPLGKEDIDVENKASSTKSKVVIEKNILTNDGEDYTITVTFGENTGITKDCLLEVREIPRDESYDEYVMQAEDMLGVEKGSVTYARFFDITILNENGNEIQPNKGTAVTVDIQLSDCESTDINVLHFGEENEVMDIQVEEDTVHFETEGFSVYAIVNIESPPNNGWSLINSIEEFEKYCADGFYMSSYDNRFITGQEYQLNASQTIIVKTAVNNGGQPDKVANATKYYFEPLGNNEYKMYCYNDNQAKQYVKHNVNSLSFTSDEMEASPFLLEYFPNNTGVFILSSVSDNTRYYWNMWSGTGGRGYGAYHVKADNNNRLRMWHYSEPEDDPLHLNGKTYGLMIYRTGLDGAAMMSEDNGSSRLSGLTLTVGTDPLNVNNTVYVANDANITMWTFTNVGPNNYYVRDTNGNYLTIDGASVYMSATPTENSLINIKYGTGSYAGKIRLTNQSGQAVNLYSGNVTQGFGGWNDSGVNEWFSLVEPSIYSEEDFIIYSANKVNISDTSQVTNGSKVMVYTRVWNENKKIYEFYALDHAGNLVPAYESGNLLKAIGLSTNNLIWDFTEYYYEDTNTPNYYYELQNSYSGKYLAPQILNGQILSDDPIGIQLDGRRNGSAYSTIFAWDDAYYDYAGFKIDSGRLVSCPSAQAFDFYFAVIKDEETELTTVNTIDNNDYGITMKMIDFNGDVANKRNVNQTNVLGLDTNVAGLLQSYLEENGYPLTDPDNTGKAQASLGELFKDANLANHLFMEAIYNESGYFEFNSTETFAELGDDGNFTLYNQLGTIEKSGQSYKHGQFLPYNSLINPATGKPYPFSKLHTNTEDIKDKPLLGANLRKGESLYAIPYTSENYPDTNTERPYSSIDYFFGMEMEFAFTQTASGLDAWNHDIIFEFSGDDDMWLYIDDNLALDLGGVHSAMSGSINFRTGIITTDRGNSTLRTAFENSYAVQHPDATEEEIEAFLDQYFYEGETVFKDYTIHKVKMFYFERGAGASNLHIKFNSTSIKQGTALLSKKVTGTEKLDYELAEFPFQIYYKLKDESTYHLLVQDSNEPNVIYKGKRTPLTFTTTYTPSGGTSSYDNVYLLKHGEEAEITFPDETESYYIAECGINPSIYDEVRINGDAIEGAENGNRFDYKTPIAMLDEHASVLFENHVSNEAIRTLTITKRLYAEDGVTLLTREQDDTTFNFRIYTSGNGASLTPLNMGAYHVKDESGNYCKWDYNTQTFVSLNKQNFNMLTENERVSATFTTSVNGAISKIPANYSIEIRNLLIDTGFKIEERDYEIPNGYMLMENGYVRVQGSYIVEDGDTPNSGIIRDNSDPVIEVRNKRSWSLTVNKVWSDVDYTEGHDTIYFAIYNKNDGVLVPGTVRQLTTDNDSLKYQFSSLEEAMTFDDYEVREVKLTGNLTADENGKVTGYDTITPIMENETLSVNTMIDNTTRELFDYTVNYKKGFPTGKIDNIRTDTVYNTRQGIKIIKTDENGMPLANAVFTLKNEEGKDIGASAYTSASDGIVTIAYLGNGEYTLTETVSPRGYKALADSVTITKSGEDISISGPIGSYLFDETGDMPTLKILNKPFDLRFIKIDRENGTLLEGVHFALYKQVMSTTGQRKDFFPMSGFEDLITDNLGNITYNFNQLIPGTYYLVETEPLPGYSSLLNDICFTIENTGNVTIISNAETSFETIDENGRVLYEVKVLNAPPTNNLQLTKYVTGNMGNKERPFSFTFHISSNTNMIPDEVEYELNGVIKYANLENGSFDFMLKHEDTIIIKNLPVKADYMITEADYSSEGYTISNSENTSGIITAGDTIYASITNTRNIAIPTGLDEKNMTILGLVLLLSFSILFLMYFRKRKVR